MLKSSKLKRKDKKHKQVLRKKKMNVKNANRKFQKINVMSVTKLSVTINVKNVTELSLTISNMIKQK